MISGPALVPGRILLALAMFAVLAACAQTRITPPQPQRAAEAIDANHRAESSLRRGDLEAAARLYGEALRLSQSIEDADAIVANAINLSVALQRLGRHDAARAALAAAIDDSPLSFSPPSLAQAALRRAILDTEQKRADAAARWLTRAESLCSEPCPLAATIQNLRGRLELEARRYDAAAARARDALASARAAGDRTETANALRLAGDAALGAGNPAAAFSALNEALAIDRELAQPRKIQLDLTVLGRAAAFAGDPAAARRWFKRALAIATAERDGEAIAELQALLKPLGSP